MRGYRRVFRLRSGTQRELEREMLEEIEAHVALRVEDLVRGGMSPARARATALEQFGDSTVLLRTVVDRERRRSRGERMQTLKHDLKLAWRHAVREPLASVVTVATFALGIGLTTAMFTLVDRVLLRPLPFAQSDELVALWGVDERGNPVGRVSYDDWLDLREQNRTLSGTAIHALRDVTVVLGERGRTFDGALVSREFFDVLRGTLVLGRGFEEADEAVGAAVVSEAMWRGRLGGAALDGFTLDVDGRALPVVGVVAAGRSYPSSTQVWVLLRPMRRGGGVMRNNVNWSAIARLAPGVTIEQARADLRSVAAGIRAAEPASAYMYDVGVVDLRDVLVSGARTAIVLLFGAVCLVLLIGCSNIAALTLARAQRRRGEVATLFALGASRGRVFRQLLTEQLVLALAGGLIGVLIAQSAIVLTGAMVAEQVPRPEELGMDVRVFAFAMFASVLAGSLAGWLPALRASIADPHTLMGRRGVVGAGRRSAGTLLLAGEVALAVTLLIGGGLLLRSLHNVTERDVGYSAAGVAAAHIALAPARYADATAPSQFWNNLLDVLRNDRHVSAAALANWVPTGTGGATYLEVEGVDGRDDSGVAYRVVSDDYFTTLRMPLLRGRPFDPMLDAYGGERVAIINELLAQKYWPRTDPIGARIRTPGQEGYDNVPWLRIVGVTTDVRHGGHEQDATAHVYVLQRQRPDHRALHVLVRAADDRPATAAQALERAVWSLDPQLAVDTRDLQHELAALTGQRRLMTGVLAAFATLALLLAAAGTFGLFSYAVAQRTQEFGVRAALGADRVRIVTLVLRGALRLVLAGCLAGTIAAFWLTQLLRSQLAGVTNRDPVTYIAAFVVILFAALVAAMLPALRAARVDPQTALRAM